MGGRSKWVEEQNGGHERRRTSDEDVGDAVLVDDLVSVRCCGIQAFQNGKNRPEQNGKNNPFQEREERERQGR